MADEYYNSIAEGYEELHGEEQHKKINLIKKYFHPKPTERLLDVGCGTGLTTEPWDCQRFGIDPAEKLLKKARQKDMIVYRLAPAEKIPFDDNHFDHVISITAIQNFNDIAKGLDEIRRVGKKSFVLTFLKRSDKRPIIERFIEEKFHIDKRLEEEKDMIFFCM